MFREKLAEVMEGLVVRGPGSAKGSVTTAPPNDMSVPRCCSCLSEGPR
jgi:hypothetical protein